MRAETWMRESIDVRLRLRTLNELRACSCDLIASLSLFVSNSSRRIARDEHRAIVLDGLVPRRLDVVHRSDFGSELPNLASDGGSEVGDVFKSFDFFPFVEDGGTGRLVRLVVVRGEVGVGEGFRDRDPLSGVEGEKFGEEVDS